jgi:hypothetical protein
MSQEELEKAIAAYPFNNKTDLEKYLMTNQFDNKGNGIDIDGEVKFKDDKTFTLWDNQGNWKALDNSKFQITFKGEAEVY